jgi:hypothetical protein
MKTKELCDNVYRDLVARLGIIQIQEDQLLKEKAELLAQIKLLNALSPEFQKLEIINKQEVPKAPYKHDLSDLDVAGC